MRLATPRMARRATPTYSGRLGMTSCTSARGLLSDTTGLPRNSELRERVRLGMEDVEDLGEACDLEDPLDADVVADQLEDLRDHRPHQDLRHLPFRGGRAREALNSWGALSCRKASLSPKCSSSSRAGRSTSAWRASPSSG